jgi:phosphatidate cytidylyltransferase
MMQMNNLLKRGATGTLFVAAIVGSICGGYWFFAGLFLIILALTIWEFYSIANHGEQNLVEPTAAFIISIAMYVSPLALRFGVHWFLLSMAIYVVGTIIIVSSELFYTHTNPLHSWSLFITGQAYIVIPFTLLNAMNAFFEPCFLLAFFVLIWAYDSGAYLVGISIGKHRLLERVSPKKSWEGAIGGWLIACGVSAVFAYYLPQLSLPEWMIYATLVAVVGTLGDLMESLMKRTLQIKDSGKILPGHGGMLDRFDSLLLSTPVIFIYLLFLLKVLVKM